MKGGGEEGHQDAEQGKRTGVRTALVISERGRGRDEGLGSEEDLPGTGSGGTGHWAKQS